MLHYSTLTLSLSLPLSLVLLAFDACSVIDKVFKLSAGESLFYNVLKCPMRLALLGYGPLAEFVVYGCLRVCF